MKVQWIGFGLLLAMCVGSTASADSLFTTAVANDGTLISDQKVRFEVGDIITLLVEEQVSAETTADTETEKESELSASADIGDNSFLRNLMPDRVVEKILPNWSMTADSEHEAEGTTARSNRLVMTVSCVVTEVMQNGNVRIQGSKNVTVNREDTQLVVSGIVRARDVSPSNTVMSTQMADANVVLKGHGPLWNNQRRGFFTRLFDWISPF